MAAEPDTDVMKVEIRKVGDVLIYGGVAVVTLPSGENRPAAFGGVVDGVRVTSDEMIEGRIKCEEGTFLGGDGEQHIEGAGGFVERLLEGLLVFGHGGDRGYGSIQARLAHFTTISNGERGLILKRLGPPVPELTLVVKGIQDGRSIALADPPLETY